MKQVELSENPYHEARWQYEVLGLRKEGLDTLMSHFTRKFGAPAFHSYDTEIFSRVGYQAIYFEKFETAISYMMFRKVPFGSSDYISLELVYGQIFAELWRLCPDRYWFYQLLTKDFRVPSLSQLWIEPVSEDLYGETESLPFIQELFVSEATKGWVGLSVHPHAFGRLRLDVESIQQADGDALRGLREWLLDVLPSSFSLRSEEEMWAEESADDPHRSIERAVNLIWNGSTKWREKLDYIARWPRLEALRSILIAAINAVSVDARADQYFLRVARAHAVDASDSFLRKLSDALHGGAGGSALEVFFVAPHHDAGQPRALGPGRDER